ncbi:type II toxin-antitoxin system HicB family antitoxin [Archaeoglobus sulfaticallidus]|uniref:type II toxin-antitoxin system HicB family antitoxin n=1 Tax=Archaeoglobus sulfaticallidus TaxID=1316941 RepID=UPI000AE5D0D1|nr:type II toxin-antitoxin system HicB family antitoxin [Archaeoglobus sulfaticallidus]
MGVGVIREYIEAAMKKARYEFLPESQVFYGEIPGLNGVYAYADSLEECKKELEEVLEEWILIRVSRSFQIPEVDGVKIVISKVA